MLGDPEEFSSLRVTNQYWSGDPDVWFQLTQCSDSYMLGDPDE